VIRPRDELLARAGLAEVRQEFANSSVTTDQVDGTQVRLDPWVVARGVNAADAATRTERVTSFRHRASAPPAFGEANALIPEQILCQRAVTGEAFVLRCAR